MKIFYGLLLIVSLMATVIVYRSVEHEYTSCNLLEEINSNADSSNQLWYDILAGIEQKTLSPQSLNLYVTHTLKRGNAIDVNWEKYGLDENVMIIYFNLDAAEGHSFSDVLTVVVGFGYRKTLSYVIDKVHVGNLTLSTYKSTNVSCDR